MSLLRDVEIPSAGLELAWFPSSVSPKEGRVCVRGPPIHAPAESHCLDSAQPPNPLRILSLLPGYLFGARSPNPIVFPHHGLVGLLRSHTKARDIMIPLPRGQDESWSNGKRRLTGGGGGCKWGAWGARCRWGVSWLSEELLASSWRLWDSKNGQGMIPSFWGMVSSSVYQVLSLPGAVLHSVHVLFFLIPDSNPIYYYALYFTGSKSKLREVK